jgi:hypothetical protein
MDRLVIESVLANVSEVFFSDSNTTADINPTIVFGFKATNPEQIIIAFNQLKTIADRNEISLAICNTLVSGMYDLELFTEVLDEPIRICNKVISPEFLDKITEKTQSNVELGLSSNVSEQENWFKLSRVEVKDCNAGLK